MDWSTYDERKFRLISQTNISKIMNDEAWATLTLEEKCEQIQEAISSSIKNSTSNKKRSKRKQALPSGMVGLIKERREKKFIQKPTGIYISVEIMKES